MPFRGPLSSIYLIDHTRDSESVVSATADLSRQTRFCGEHPDLRLTWGHGGGGGVLCPSRPSPGVKPYLARWMRDPEFGQQGWAWVAEAELDVPGMPLARGHEQTSPVCFRVSRSPVS